VFDQWLASQEATAAAPSNAEAQQGQQVFGDQPCAACHTVRGTAAIGTAGPDLTHFASRATLGAGVLTNDDQHLSEWIANAQAAKPGNLMPRLDLSADEVRALTAYVEGLR
jgi:cytochrome c oxidase subunit 2